MKVNFYAALRKITGKKTIEFPLPVGITVQGLIESIILHYPQMRAMLLNNNGELNRHAHVFINGRDVPFLENTQETTLSKDDTVDIFPPGHF